MKASLIFPLVRFNKGPLPQLLFKPSSRLSWPPLFCLAHRGCLLCAPSPWPALFCAWERRSPCCPGYCWHFWEGPDHRVLHPALTSCVQFWLTSGRRKTMRRRKRMTQVEEEAFPFLRTLRRAWESWRARAVKAEYTSHSVL